MVVNGLVQIQAILEKNIRLRGNIKTEKYILLNLMEQTVILLIDFEVLTTISEKRC